MAKKRKQDVPKYIQSKFLREQYKPGDYVCITWLGGIKFGQVIDIDKKHEHVRYKVKSHGKYYTCGIQIKEFLSENTDYGILLADETDRRGAAAIRSKSTGKELHELDRRSTASAQNETTSTRQHVNDINNATTTGRGRKTTKSKNAVEHGTSHDTKTKPKLARSKKTELDNAVQKQRDFLNGFVKK
jgi:hypothetical protein